MTRESGAAGDSTPPRIQIVPATPEPVLDGGGGPPTMPMPAVTTPVDFAPALVQPTSIAEPAVTYVVADPGPPLAVDPIYVAQPLPRSWWPVVVAAVVAAVAGGLIGFLIGDRSDDGGTALAPTDSSTVSTEAIPADQAAVNEGIDAVLTVLLAQAEANGGAITPTPYPKLDQLLAIAQGAANDQASDASGLQGELDAANVARADLADQVATLEQQTESLQEQLTTLQAERDDLAASSSVVGQDGEQDDDEADAAQQTIDQQSSQIEELQRDLGQARADLDDARSALADVQSDADQANQQLEALDVRQMANVVGTDVANARNLADAGGWTIVEQPVVNASVPPNSVTTQFPGAGANMITGSVLYVEVATRS